jgi:hypothetical protein
MSNASVLAAGRATFTLDRAGSPKHPEQSLSLSITSTVFGRIPVVVASGDGLGVAQTWRPGDATSCPLEVMAFPVRELAAELSLHLSLAGDADWTTITPTIGVELELTFADPGREPQLWSPPRVDVETVGGPSHRFVLPPIALR